MRLPNFFAMGGESQAWTSSRPRCQASPFGGGVESEEPLPALARRTGSGVEQQIGFRGLNAGTRRPGCALFVAPAESALRPRASRGKSDALRLCAAGEVAVRGDPGLC